MTDNNRKALIAYFSILFIFCFAFIVGAKLIGENGKYLAQGYMLTPAISAIITRTFFYQKKYTDAKLQIGKLSDYLKFWLMSLSITLLSFLFFYLLGAISWDFSGNSFIERLSKQFEDAGQNINDSLPPGFTPKTMLILMFIGGLTIFNIIPGIITGFGEEFGHRGFMFPLLYQIRPWVGLIFGGIIWYAWHLPLALVIPKVEEIPLWKDIINFFTLGIGGICTFIFLSYVYIKSQSVFVTSVAHIVMNNSGQSFSYFIVLKSQFLANIGLTIALIIVILWLYFRNEFSIFKEYFQNESVI